MNRAVVKMSRIHTCKILSEFVKSSHAAAFIANLYLKLLFYMVILYHYI